MNLMIDPGHGGVDPGAVFRGIAEKEITLAICLELERLLHGSSIQTKLTRQGDATTGITARALLANAWRADAFLSVHCNADADPDQPGMPEATGGEVYYLSNAGAAMAAAVGKAFARELPEEPWRGMKPARFGVLRQTRMPAVLVEVGFIDNSSTVRKLKDPAVQHRIAFALLRAVLEWDR